MTSPALSEKAGGMNEQEREWTNLCMFGVAGLLDLVVPLLGEANAERAQQVAVCSLHIDMGLNQGLQWKARKICLIYLFTFFFCRANIIIMLIYFVTIGGLHCEGKGKSNIKKVKIKKPLMLLLSSLTWHKGVVSAGRYYLWWQLIPFSYRSWEEWKLYWIRQLNLHKLLIVASLLPFRVAVVCSGSDQHGPCYWSWPRRCRLESGSSLLWIRSAWSMLLLIFHSIANFRLCWEGRLV